MIKDTTTIVEGAGSEDDVKGRIAQIKREIDDTDSDWDRRSSRSGWPSWPAAWPSSRSAPPRWSSRRSTASRTRCRRLKAIEEGVVPGGAPPSSGPVRRCPPKLKGDEATGAIVYKALLQPAHWIAANAGLEGRWPRSRSSETGNVGLNAASGGEDLLKAGVIDPAKVTMALQNAASIASLLLTTEALITDKPEEEKALGHASRRRWHGWHRQHGGMGFAPACTLSVRWRPARRPPARQSASDFRTPGTDVRAGTSIDEPPGAHRPGDVQGAPAGSPPWTGRLDPVRCWRTGWSGRRGRPPGRVMSKPEDGGLRDLLAVGRRRRACAHRGRRFGWQLIPPPRRRTADPPARPTPVPKTAPWLDLTAGDRHVDLARVRAAFSHEAAQRRPRPAASRAPRPAGRR